MGASTPTRAGFGGCACTCAAPWTAPPARRSSPPPTKKEREVALRLLPLALRGGEAVVCDKGYSGRDFEREVHQRFGAVVLRPRRKNEPPQPLNVSKLRQQVESIIWTLKDRLGLERHGARTFAGLRARIASKLLALAAGVWLNHHLNRPTRAFATLAA